ncbi:protein CHROMATIN REMODELING 4 [Prunus yedoensis var. nudiflora]|uniref:Protein CHROMATIN REMODELING 4 n=1 Tax=Prunus yedoensis var. nudiflora TaxID=2094558 RepID=A0A314UTL5_PRUYE|nr:protein CHROMATIN REMODELING 4 [Prunus yedoensis var. nudiflora]
MGMSPSPEVLQLVASCVAPGPHLSAASGMASSSFHDTKPSLPNSVDKTCDTESGDSSKTQSDPSRTERPDVEEISSEGTVSDHPLSDREP